MRRTRLVAAAFVGTLCLTSLVPATAVASSEPTAEVQPRRVRPGGTVTITVTCPKGDPKDPYITAYSQAFAKGEATLRLVRRGSGSGSGSGYGKPTYRGTARIAAARNFTSSSGSAGSYRSEESSRFEESYGSESYGSESYGSESYGSESSGSTGSSGSRESSGAAEEYGEESFSEESFSEDSYSSGSSSSSSGSASSGSSYSSGDDYGRGSGHRGKAWGINGSCPGGDDFTTSVIVERKPRGGPPAGQGGSQDRLDPATVAAGGALLSATVGFAVYLLRRRHSEL